MADWIKSATSNSHGQFRAKAAKAGMSTHAYAEKMKSKGGKTGKQANLALTLMKASKSSKRSKKRSGRK